LRSCSLPHAASSGQVARGSRLSTIETESSPSVARNALWNGRSRCLLLTHGLFTLTTDLLHRMRNSWTGSIGPARRVRWASRAHVRSIDHIHWSTPNPDVTPHGSGEHGSRRRQFMRPATEPGARLSPAHGQRLGARRLGGFAQRKHSAHRRCRRPRSTSLVNSPVGGHWVRPRIQRLGVVIAGSQAAVLQQCRARCRREQHAPGTSERVATNGVDDDIDRVDLVSNRVA